MTITQFLTWGSIISIFAGGISYLLNKIISKVKHEVNQDDKISNLLKHQGSCIAERKEQCDCFNTRLEALEKNSQSKDLLLVSITEKMEALHQGHENTQTMIAQLQDNQQSTFVNLIDVIKEMNR